MARRGALAGLLALAIAVAPALAAASGDGSDDRLEQLTRVFASLDVRDMDGRRWTRVDLAGRVVVLDFWATWCAPCLAEIPHLRRLQADFGADRVQVLGVSLDASDRRTLVSWLNRQRVSWPQVWDGRAYDGTLAERFGVASLPTSVLVGPDGRVRALNLRGDRLRAAVAALVGEVR